MPKCRIMYIMDRKNATVPGIARCHHPKPRSMYTRDNTLLGNQRQRIRRPIILTLDGRLSVRLLTFAMQSGVRLRSAPAKPPTGRRCNGCGICCAAVTCPVGRLVFLRKRGPCPALIWDDATTRYWCGLVREPGQFFVRLPKPWTKVLVRVICRWIAANTACDSDGIANE